MRSRSFIDLGVEWHYITDGDVETVHTDGPLHDPVVVLVIIPPLFEPGCKLIRGAKGIFQ